MRPKIGSTDFQKVQKFVPAILGCHDGIWSGEPGLGATVLPKIGSTDFRKVQETVQTIFGFGVNILIRFGLAEAKFSIPIHMPTLGEDCHLRGSAV